MMILTVVSFLLVMSIVVFVHELGHFLVAKRSGIVVEEFGFGFPPRLIKLGERDGTVYSINAIPFGGFVRMRGEDDPSQPGSFASASKLARTLTLVAGAGMNFLLAIVLLAVLTVMTGVPDETRPGTLVKGIAAGSPAEQAGLQIGDRIVSADGIPLAGVEGLQSYTASHAGQSVVYGVVRSGSDSGETTVAVTMTPRTKPPADQGALGIQIDVLTRPPKVWEAAWSGIRTTGEVIYLTFQIPANMIREGRPISDAGFMGPVGIAATTGEVVRSAVAVSSVTPVLWFIGLLSIALGVTNLLPIPGLDGGRLLFVIVEAVRRKRIEPSQEGVVHLIGFALLLLLVGVITIREITSLINGTFPTLGIN
jgi:regulator of sigma E protease